MHCTLKNISLTDSLETSTFENLKKKKNLFGPHHKPLDFRPTVLGFPLKKWSDSWGKKTKQNLHSHKIKIIQLQYACE